MNFPKLFIVSKNGQKIKFLVGHELCDNCGCELYREAYHITEWNKFNPGKITVLCGSCVKDVSARPPNLAYLEVQRVLLVADFDGLPSNAVPIVPKGIPMTDFKGGASVYDAASQKTAPSMRVNDKTLLAGRECLDGTETIGAPDMDLLAEKDSPPKNVDGLLSDLAFSSEALTVEEKQLLSDKREKDWDKKRRGEG